MKRLLGVYEKASAYTVEIGAFSSVRASAVIQRYPCFFLLLLGAALLWQNLVEPASAEGGTPREACNRVLGLAEGAFGALVASVAGIAAIVSAAAGGYRAAWNLLIVSVGAFILRSYISIFQGNCAQ
jgi:hypothetical protein